MQTFQHARRTHSDLPMAFKIVLIIAFAAQVIASLLALRLNFRYRIYSAWFFVSAAAIVGAIVRLTTLLEHWELSPSIYDDSRLWFTALAALMASILLLAAMCLIEPFFKQLARIEDALRSEHKQLTFLVKENEEEMRLAQRIQRQLLPAEAPQLAGIDIYGESIAAVWTSGDYFDYLELAGGATAVVIADVSGHGLGPALLMSSMRASFRGLAPTTGHVGELLTRGNRAVCETVSGSEFVTAISVRYDELRRELQFAAAGHVGYLLSCDGTTRTLKGDAPPLGIIPELVIDQRSQADVRPGDILILVTDGILEARNRKGEMFGESRLLDTVKNCRRGSSKEIVQSLFAATREFCQGLPHEDDITAVALKFA